MVFVPLRSGTAPTLWKPPVDGGEAEARNTERYDLRQYNKSYSCIRARSSGVIAEKVYHSARESSLHFLRCNKKPRRFWQPGQKGHPCGFAVRTIGNDTGHVCNVPHTDRNQEPASPLEAAVKTGDTVFRGTALGPRLVFRLDKVHAHSRHATDNRSLGRIAEVLRPAF